MHTHVSGVTVFYVFLGVLIAGTFWRLGSGYLVHSKNPFLVEVGKAAGFQF